MGRLERGLEADEEGMTELEKDLPFGENELKVERFGFADDFERADAVCGFVLNFKDFSKAAFA